MKVYDILNAGPRRRFTVRGKGGKPFIVHNCVQGMARDVFAESLLHLEDANLTPTLHVHDEVVVEVDSTADLDRVVQLMEKTPEWAPGLPVGAEGKIMERYGK